MTKLKKKDISNCTRQKMMEKGLFAMAVSFSAGGGELRVEWQFRGEIS
jgi:hypothetical protein